MKKQTLLIALAFGISSAFAQDLTSKKGERILPEPNDWAIGFDALPIMNSIGHMLSNSSNSTAVNNPWGNTKTIIGKLYKDEKTAYRAMVGINFSSSSYTAYVDQTSSTATPQPKVEDKLKLSSHEITLGAGMEKRRGTTRLQGYYGAMLYLTLGGGSKATYTYGNAITAANPSVDYTQWSINSSSVSDTATSGGQRTTQSKNGSTLGFTVAGFIGAEYFIAPKISVGAEYSWGLGYSSTGKGTYTQEKWDAASSSLKPETTDIGKRSAMNIGVSIASLMVTLHF